MPDPARRGRRYPIVLLVVFLLYAAAWAYRPADVATWALENAIAAVFVLALIASYRRFPFSNVSYTLIFVFLCVHTIGAHYTYSLVPYDAWVSRLTGTTINSIFGFQRNHYDRLIHFLFGLMLAYPTRELFVRIAGVRGFWGYYLPLDLTMSFSMLYELIEWGAASIASEVGPAYLGTQGDVWDAQKDMALATLGALICMLIVAWINWKFDKNFGAEMRESFTVKGDALGEARLRELMRAREP